MILFDLILMLHFSAFLLFLVQVAILFPRQEKILHKKSIFLGLGILITGITLVALTYPQVNLYKIVPKSILFIAISVVCGVYSGKNIPLRMYNLLIGMTVLASLIAVVKV